MYKVNKKFLIIFFVLIFSLFFSCNVFASTSSKYYSDIYSNDDIFTRVPDDVLDKFYSSDVYNSGDYYILITKNDITKYKVSFIPKTEGFKTYFDGSKIRCTLTVPETKIYMADDNGLGRLIGTYNWSSDDYWHDSTNLFYADFSVYSDDTFTDFFFNAPMKTVLARQVEQVEMSQVLQEVLGVLPLIIVLLVSLVGLRKGLKMLVTFLHRS